MPVSIQERWLGIAERIARTKLARVFIGLVLVGYVGLGIQSYLAFQGPLMQDLDTYLNAYAQALKGIDPYPYSNILTAYLYPLPGLLVAAPFFYVPEGFLRAAVFIAVNLALLAMMLRGIAVRYGYRWKDYWWWIPLAFGFAPLFETFRFGQTNVVTSFGTFLVLAYSGVVPALVGLGLMLAVVTKLVPVVFFIYLGIQRRYREIAWGLGILAGAYAISYFLFGWQSPGAYLEVMKNLARRWAGADSWSLVSILYAQGWIEAGAWTGFQRVLLGWTALIFAASGIGALASRRWEPLFIIVSIGSIFVTNVMWYHYYVFLLLPLFVWLAWSRFHPAIVAWCVSGLILIQLEPWFWKQGLVPHLFAHFSMLGILAWQIAHIWRSKSFARVIVGAGALPAVVILGVFLYDAIDANANLVKARRWIDANLPTGATLAVESYGPSVSRKYSTTEFQDLLAQPADWYEKNGWEYVVTGYGTHSGASLVPTFQPSPAERYADFLSRFSLVTRVADQSHAIGVYKTGATGPTRRVSARFGFLGEWLDLVGYDSRESRLQAGEPLLLTFYWRAVQQKRYPLQLTVRLLDQSDREITSSAGELFGANSGDRWSEGITRVPWKIAVPATAAPGLYRVELDVDCIGMGRMPVLPFADQPFSDKLYLGPFKVSPPTPSQDALARARSTNARFGDALSLRGFTINPVAARAGENLQVKLYWQSIAKPDKDYTVFLHLLDASGNIRAQVDAQPFGGSYPTSIWDAGEVVRDEYDLALPRDLAPGDYRIALGLYEYPSLARLSVTGANGETVGDHLILEDVVRLGTSKP